MNFRKPKSTLPDILVVCATLNIIVGAYQLNTLSLFNFAVAIFAGCMAYKTWDL